MGWELVAEGSVVSLPNLAVYEPQLPEGSYNLLELNLRLPVSPTVAQDLEDALRDAGVEGVRVTVSSPQLNIYFRKGFPWLAVIVTTILASLVVAALVISWRLLTYVGAVAPWAVPWIMLAVVAGATLIAVSLIRRRI